jgi:hypothetical protein
MRTVVIMLLLGHLLHALSEGYLLPDAKHELIHQLRQHIDTSRKGVICITPSLQSSRLTDLLAAAARRHLPLTLISGGNDDGARLVQFQTVDYRILRGLSSDIRDGELAMTLLLFDDYGCFGSALLSDMHLSQDISLMECTDDPDRLRHLRDIADRLYRRSASYLEEAASKIP